MGAVDCFSREKSWVILAGLIGLTGLKALYAKTSCDIFTNT